MAAETLCINLIETEILFVCNVVLYLAMIPMSRYFVPEDVGFTKRL